MLSNFQKVEASLIEPKLKKSRVNELAKATGLRKQIFNLSWQRRGQGSQGTDDGYYMSMAQQDRAEEDSSLKEGVK